MEGTFGPSPAVAVCASIADAFTKFGFEDFAAPFSMADLDALRSLVRLNGNFVRLLFTSPGMRTTLKCLPLIVGMASGWNACYCSVVAWSAAILPVIYSSFDIWKDKVSQVVPIRFRLPKTRTRIYQSTSYFRI